MMQEYSFNNWLRENLRQRITRNIGQYVRCKIPRKFKMLEENGEE